MKNIFAFSAIIGLLFCACSFKEKETSENVFADAQWIGGGEGDMSLYAQYLTTFRLAWDVSADGKDCAWVKLGGGDARFLNKYRNPWHLQNEANDVYVRVETDSKKGEVRFYRSGMQPGDNDKKAQRVLSASVLKGVGSHKVELAVAFGIADVSVDGEKIGTVNLNPTRGKMDEALQASGDFLTYPCLGNVTCGDGVSNVELRHFRSPKNLIAKVEKPSESQVGESIFKDRSALQLRTSFVNEKAVKEATLYITARGIYDAYLNGALINESEYFCPGFTQYDLTHLYQTFDVTKALKDGENQLEVELGEGWWSGASTYTAQNWNFYGDRQSLLARLHIIYNDGETQDIVTNPESWQCCSDGARLCASMFQGEVVDGRRPLFDENSNWHQAVVVPTEGTVVEGEDYSRMELIPQNDAPVHPIDTLSALSTTEVRPKVFVYDMGQNCAAVPLIILKNQKPGTEVRLRFAEVLYPELPQFGYLQGEILTENYRAAISQDIYICGGGEETFSPRQTMHGYRYIEITGIDESLPLDQVKSIALSSLDGTTAHYECSDTLVNRLWENILWSARSNFISIPTDCPQRNERMGWSGDISVFSHTVTYLSDVEEFLRRHLRSMRDTQTPEGMFADVSPMRGEGFGGLLWGSAGITVAWECYRQWGNLNLLREHYDAMARYMDYVAEKYVDSEKGIIVQGRGWGGLGDWLSPEYDQNDHSLLWECYYIYDLDIMSKVSALLRKKESAEEYAALRDKRKAFFRETYLDKTDYHTICSSFEEERQGEAINTQTSYILPLAMDICEGEVREALANHLVRLIEANNYHLMVGFIGVPWIGEALMEIGRPDLIYRILSSTEYPSWLYSVTQGATSIWERLNAYVAGEGFPAGNGMNSFNHYSFGSVGSWMIEHSLGISRDPQNPGFKHFILQPMPDPTGHISWARGHFDSREGRIESGWQYNPDASVTYSFTIPRGTTATVILPGQEPQEFKSGRYEIRQ